MSSHCCNYVKDRNYSATTDKFEPLTELDDASAQQRMNELLYAQQKELLQIRDRINNILSITKLFSSL